MTELQAPDGSESGPYHHRKNGFEAASRPMVVVGSDRFNPKNALEVKLLEKLLP